MGKGSSWLGAKKVDLPKTRAQGTSSMGDPTQNRRWSELGVSSQQSPRGEKTGHTVALVDPNTCSKEAALPALLHGLDVSGSCSPFPKGTWG